LPARARRGSTAAAQARTEGEHRSQGRICGEAGCSTVLSVYNGTSFCGIHSRRDWRANREPRRRSSGHHGEPAAAADDDGF
jgi:hypothetical protein